jgi:F-type H+-transporting ATPase subunit a
MSQGNSVSISIKPETVTQIMSVDITNSMITAGIISILLCIFAFIVGLTLKNKTPNKIQLALEVLYNSIESTVSENLQSKQVARRYIGVFIAMAVFIVLGSWVGLLPGMLQTYFYNGAEYVHFFRAPTTDLNFTIILGLVAFVTIQAYAFKTLGLNYLSKFFTLKDGAVGAFVGILEFCLEWVKIISFSLRLYGNIFAGEAMIIVFLYLARLGNSDYWIGIPVPSLIIGLEVFVALIQAYVLISLTSVFMAGAAEDHNAH